MNEWLDKGIFLYGDKEKLYFKEFDKKDLNSGDKFIQVYFRGRPYLRFGKSTEHKEILKLTLEDFGIKKLKLIKNSFNIEIPSPKDLENYYEMVGAGTITKAGKIFFGGQSTLYEGLVGGTNKPHLEELFEKQNVSLEGTDPFGPTFSVKI